MRIISGTAKGHTIRAPKGFDTRPTQDRVRESIFNVLSSRWNLYDRHVLDLFSGTGALVIEALSRGARKGIAVDLKTEPIIKENGAHCKVLDRLTVLRTSIHQAAKRLEGNKFYLIFSDPPYNKGFVKETISLVVTNQLLDVDGVLIIERHEEEPLALPDGWISQRELKFGYTRVNFCVQTTEERS